MGYLARMQKNTPPRITIRLTRRGRIALVLTGAVVAGTAGLVVVGIEGRFKERAPRAADRMARAAQHLNGDGTPPRAFQRLS